MKSGIVDAHTHAFPPQILKDREAYCALDYWFEHLYADPRAVLTGERELLESMDESGIDFAVIAGFPWSDQGLCREHNAWLAGVCASHPDRLGYLATVVPQEKDAAVVASTAFDAGALGIGELNANAQGFDLRRSEEMRDLMDLCRERGKPVMLHASEPLGHTYPGKGNATPAKIATWLESYSEQPVILAHWGGGLPFFELMPEIRKLCRNVVYDSAATTYLYTFEVFQTVIGLTGPDRVLFGSDFPVLGQKRLLGRVKQALSDHPALPDVLGENARRFLNLEARVNA